jgi:hypothetical protein
MNWPFKRLFSLVSLLMILQMNQLGGDVVAFGADGAAVTLTLKKRNTVKALRTSYDNPSGHLTSII